MFKRSMRKKRKNMVMLEYSRPCMLGLDDVAFIACCEWSRKQAFGCPVKEGGLPTWHSW